MSQIGSFFNRFNLFDHHRSDAKKKHINTENLADFARIKQQHAIKKNDDQSLQIANDEALAFALQASLNEQNELVPKHNRIPTQAESLQIANDAALAQAIQASLNEHVDRALLHSMTATHAQANQIADDEALAQAIEASQKEEKPSQITTFYRETRNLERANSDKLRNWFNQNGYRVIPNSGQNNNCLLISLLQHATGNYRSQHTEKAAHYKSILENESKGTIGRLDPLYSDTPAITELIKRIGEDYGREISVKFCFPDHDGTLAERIVGSGANPVTIFDQGEHFEAVLPPSNKA